MAKREHVDTVLNAVMGEMTRKPKSKRSQKQNAYYGRMYDQVEYMDMSPWMVREISKDKTRLLIEFYDLRTDKLKYSLEVPSTSVRKISSQ